MESLTDILSSLTQQAVAYWPTIEAFIITYAQEASFIALGAILVWLVSRVRLRHERRRLQRGRLPHEVIVTVSIFDDEPDGMVLLKPRTAQSAQPIDRAFPNPALVDMIVKATERCDDTALGSFIILPDAQMHETFMRRVRDIASELGGPGHIVRACGGEYREYICYVCCSFSMEGPHRKIRIDLIGECDLKRLTDGDFIARVTNRPDEGSHADLLAILRICAEKHTQGAVDERDFVRRTSISIPV